MRGRQDWLTEEEKHGIAELYFGRGLMMLEIAAKYDTTRQAISRIVHNPRYQPKRGRRAMLIEISRRWLAEQAAQGSR